MAKRLSRQARLAEAAFWRAKAERADAQTVRALAARHGDPVDYDQTWVHGLCRGLKGNTARHGAIALFGDTGKYLWPGGCLCPACCERAPEQRAFQRVLAALLLAAMAEAGDLDFLA